MGESRGEKLWGVASEKGVGGEGDGVVLFLRECLGMGRWMDGWMERGRGWGMRW